MKRPRKLFHPRETRQQRKWERRLLQVKRLLKEREDG